MQQPRGRRATAWLSPKPRPWRRRSAGRCDGSSPLRGCHLGALPRTLGPTLARLLCMVCRSSEALCHCPSFPQALMATDRWNLEALGLSKPGPGGLIELDALGQQLILWPSDARSCGRGASKGNTWGAGRRRSCSVNRRGSQPRSIQTHSAAPDSCGTHARRRTSLFRSVRPCARGFAPHSACR